MRGRVEVVGDCGGCEREFEPETYDVGVDEEDGIPGYAAGERDDIWG